MLQAIGGQLSDRLKIKIFHDPKLNLFICMKVALSVCSLSPVWFGPFSASSPVNPSPACV